MSSKVQIWCPSCQKRYSIPAGMESKSVACKNCQARFKVSDALRNPATPVHQQPQSANPALVHDPLADLPVAKPIAHPAALPAVDSVASMPNAPSIPAAPPVQPTVAARSSFQVEDIFNHQSLGPGIQNASAGQPMQPRVQHLPNPFLIPSVIGAVLLSLGLALVAFMLPFFLAANATN